MLTGMLRQHNAARKGNLQSSMTLDLLWIICNRSGAWRKCQRISANTLLFLNNFLYRLIQEKRSLFVDSFWFRLVQRRLQKRSSCELFRLVAQVDFFHSIAQRGHKNNQFSMTIAYSDLNCLRGAENSFSKQYPSCSHKRGFFCNRLIGFALSYFPKYLIAPYDIVKNTRTLFLHR